MNKDDWALIIIYLPASVMDMMSLKGSFGIAVMPSCRCRNDYDSMDYQNDPYNYKNNYEPYKFS
jgi:hypothetical protein